MKLEVFFRAKKTVSELEQIMYKKNLLIDYGNSVDSVELYLGEERVVLDIIDRQIVVDALLVHWQKIQKEKEKELDSIE